jgi:hypothetical protein
VKKPNARACYGNPPQSPEEIRGFLCNPIYAGIPPYPAVVRDEQWVKAALKLIKEEGAEQFLVNLLHLLRGSMEEARSLGA